jgi:hypothetical protein
LLTLAGIRCPHLRGVCEHTTPVFRFTAIVILSSDSSTQHVIVLASLGPDPLYRTTFPFVFTDTYAFVQVEHVGPSRQPMYDVLDGIWNGYCVRACHTPLVQHGKGYLHVLQRANPHCMLVDFGSQSQQQYEPRCIQKKLRQALTAITVPYRADRDRHQ